MKQTAMLFASVVLFLGICRQAQGIIALDELFPFGSTANDTKMWNNDDDSVGPIPLPHIFPYFDNNHRQIYVANNGLFSFLGGIREYTPEPFPLDNDRRLITPFWADIDTRGTTGYPQDNSLFYQVHSRQPNQSEATRVVLEKSSNFVRLYFPNERPFTPLLAVVATWYRVGAYRSKVDRLNTFQMVIVTDELRSFAFFLYHDLQWAGVGYVAEPYAQAGFNAGDGLTSTTLVHSRTEDMGRLVNESNVNVPGLFVFRIDTVDMEAGGCGASETALTFQPTAGSQIGGTAVNIQGPCFEPEAEVLCRFGSHAVVSGVVLSQFRIRCLSPVAVVAGRVPLDVSLDNGTTFRTIGQYTFILMNDQLFNSDDIVVRSNDSSKPSFSWDGEIDIYWFYSESTFTSFPPNEVVIDIGYEIYNTEPTRRDASNIGLEINTVIVLASGIIPQLGHQSVHLNLSEVVNRERIFSTLPAIVMGGVRIVARHALKAAIKYVVKKVIKYAVKKVAENLCDAWSNRQPDPSTWTNNLSPCPNTLQQATVALAIYESDSMCKINAPNPFNCWFHQGRPQYNEDNAVACFRSKAVNSQGAGSQCCYNKEGQIITRGTGAGSDDRYHSGKNFFGHQIHDVLPFIACCKIQDDPEKCNNYARYRPARPGSDTNGQFGGTWGDPHFFTLDGTAYTFNGYGEYTYLNILESQASSSGAAYNLSLPTQFASQIRTVPLPAPSNDVTVIKAFAVEYNAVNISITISRRNQVIVRLNGNILVLERNPDALVLSDTIMFQIDEIAIIKNLTDGQITLSWPIGISVVATPVSINTTASLALGIAVAISDAFRGHWTYGLIGGYDGDSSNDLRSSDGTLVGTVDSLTVQQIHQLFGVTWAIDPEQSLFSYETGENAHLYASENHMYQPTFQEPSAATPSLESAARAACNILDDASSTPNQWTTAQRTCYYDAVITGDLSFGQASRQAADQQVEQREAIRNPPKFDTSKVPLAMDVYEKQLVRLSFSAISEFSKDISYQFLNGPEAASFDASTGLFQWTVPKNTDQKQTPVKVSATDALYHLTSTHEVVLNLVRNTAAQTAMISSIMLLLCLAATKLV